MLASTTIQSMLSCRAGASRQGEVQGALGSLQGLSLVIGPTLAGLVLDAATRPGGAIHRPGAPFALAAAACLLALGSVASGGETDATRA